MGKLQNAGGTPTYLEAIVCRQQQQAGWLIVGMVVREREREKTFPQGPCKGLCRSQGKGSESRLGLSNYIIHRIWLTIIWPQRRGREWATAGYPLRERGLERATEGQRALLHLGRPINWKSRSKQRFDLNISSRPRAREIDASANEGLIPWLSQFGGCHKKNWCRKILVEDNSLSPME